MTLLLVEIRPNHVGRDEWYEYDRRIAVLRKLGRPPERRDEPNGLVARYRDLRLRQRAVVFFVERDEAFLDVGRGPESLSRGEISISTASHFIVTSLVISRREGAGEQERRYAVTPPWRLLLNDGMFPESVEPVRELAHLVNNAEKLAEWTSGEISRLVREE